MTAGVYTIDAAEALAYLRNRWADDAVVDRSLRPYARKALKAADVALAQGNPRPALLMAYAHGAIGR